MIGGEAISVTGSDSDSMYKALPPNVQEMCEVLMVRLRRREVQGAFEVGKAMLEVLRVVVSFAGKQGFSGKEFMALVKSVGSKIHQTQPLEFTIGNITRRVLTFMREGYDLARNNYASADVVSQIHSLKTYLSSSPNDFSHAFDVTEHVLNEINELEEEMANSYQVISEQAQEHIHANEVIMTYGQSRTVEKFLLDAASFRKFEVIVAESAPSGAGKKTVEKLAGAGLQCTLITDTAVFAMMARVNKVIVGTHAVMANGGLIAHTGLHVMALAAKCHSVPVVVCSGLFKLCPLYSFDQDTFQDLKSPGAVLGFHEIDSEGQIEVCNPAYDYIPPELVNILVTNSGGHAPSYIYRLLAEYYHRDDYQV